MDKFLLNKQQILNSFESLTFVISVLFVIALVIVYLYIKYRKLKTDVLIQVKSFNSTIFLSDKMIFERYQYKKELKKQDFIRMYKDSHFREHLWRKEIGYYKELVNIVENLRWLELYKWSMVILLLGFIVLVAFIVRPLL